LREREVFLDMGRDSPVSSLCVVFPVLPEGVLVHVQEGVHPVIRHQRDLRLRRNDNIVVRVFKFKKRIKVSKLSNFQVFRHKLYIWLVTYFIKCEA
jgi:hypothetical protein